MIRPDRQRHPPLPRGASPPTELGPPRSTACDVRSPAVGGQPVEQAAPGPRVPSRTDPAPQRPVQFHRRGKPSPRPPAPTRPRRASRMTPRRRGRQAARKTPATVPGSDKPLPATPADGPASLHKWQAGWRPVVPGRTAAALVAAVCRAASRRRPGRSRQATCAAPRPALGPRPQQSSADRRRSSARSSPTVRGVVPAAQLGHR